jgi:alpha-D-ribose 1-methylphosphonate 5-triphosphate diphosphatase
MNVIVRDKPALLIEGGHVLIDGDLQCAALQIDARDGVIAKVDGGAGPSRRLRADGLVVLPGIVDIHGDAFERQMMPRPGVGFPLDVAFAESDRQAIANGITTVFHGLTWSWEPGLRGLENARAVVACVERLRPQLAADTRIHLRHETYNLDAEAEVISWLNAHRVDALAFNDHMAIAAESSTRPHKLTPMVERSGLTRDAFLALVDSTKCRAGDVPDSIRRLAKAAVANGIPLLSHDDTDPAQRQWFRALGCKLAEFPTTAETAQDAAAAGDYIVLGAPNVVRGGSHTGWINAADMIRLGCCSILASDYYYPAPLLAAFRLAADEILPLSKAWALVSTTPASAVGLNDRGRLAAGQRADLILVDASDILRPRLIAAMVRGRLVHVADASRLAG